MLRTLAVIVTVSSSTMAWATSPAAAPAATDGGTPALTQAEINNILYVIGHNFGDRVAKDFVLSKAEIAELQKGIGDGASGAKARAAASEYMPKVQQLVQARAAAKQEVEKTKAAAEKKKAEAFLTKMAAEKGAVKSESGLVMFNTKVGSGASPAPTDTVSVHYKGTLIDGTEFDSSYKRGQPTEFPLNGVIKCWTEGVGKMKVGGKAKLICPSSIAYGDSGAGGQIPGGATLIFEVELLSIKGK